MNIDATPYRTIWLADDGCSVNIIDQTRLPHAFEIVTLKTLADAARAIQTMQVRGAPLIGATAAYGICLALRENVSDDSIDEACKMLYQTRPTAVNLRWALDQMQGALRNQPAAERLAIAYRLAAKICDDDVAMCRQIGHHGLPIIEAIAAQKRPGEPVNVLTHCNAGWLATVDWGTATAPIYRAFDAGIAIHVWVDETRPRNQGAALTAFELGQHGVPHTVIADNAGGHLMQHGEVDLCLVGSDRTARSGDVCNKIGTYLKALAAQDNGVPFYVALPSTTIDWSIDDGLADIPIEQRDADEVARISGLDDNGAITTVRLTPRDSAAANYAFDVTPAHLVSGLITERGAVGASRTELEKLFPEQAQNQTG